MYFVPSCLRPLLYLVAALFGGISICLAQIEVACVGDSITAGYGLSNPGTDSYPAQLQALLGSEFSVGNFGLSGSTALKRSDYTYWRSYQYRAGLKSKPDIVIIMLGTNDSKAWNWNAAKFDADYRDLIDQYRRLATQPEIFICLPPPVYEPNAFGTTFDPEFIQNTLLPAIRNIATGTGVFLVDNNAPLLNSPEYFPDGVHPNAQAAGIIAATVQSALAAP